MVLCKYTQIPFADFGDDGRKFDFIFLNDVFEHVADPLFVLKQLSGKLRSTGKLFVYTPKQFWIYPIAQLVSKPLYLKVLKGTVFPQKRKMAGRKQNSLRIVNPLKKKEVYAMLIDKFNGFVKSLLDFLRSHKISIIQPFVDHRGFVRVELFKKRLRTLLNQYH